MQVKQSRENNQVRKIAGVMRIKILVTLVFIFCTLLCTAQKQISYDGYYVSLPDSGTISLFKYYLRFYPDGTVIGVNTAGKPDNLLPWFKKENKTPYKGKYTVNKTAINFSMISEEGNVVYDGTITPDNKLLLTVKSVINKYDGKEEYSFMKM